ncbi:hypothetical protein AVEN_244663-1 [Araneus ventricosus]|uniref:Uncharacterized protein n=1 Tax=Araneus ventricosus TaxID=182803 RepID=A0A4Y2KJH7_ARAVE|nr:hypothetical protein AVEN_244663-1 [Araneus ventricosus]
MCYTTEGLEVVRVGLVNIDGLPVYDGYVKPKGKILDYNTLYSGVEKSHLQNVTVTLDDVKTILSGYIQEDTILVNNNSCYTTDGLKVVRVGLVNDDGLAVYDRFYFLASQNLDFNTVYRRVSKRHLHNATVTIDDFKKFEQLHSPGHNHSRARPNDDLVAFGLIHNTAHNSLRRDTRNLYPPSSTCKYHPRRAAFIDNSQSRIHGCSPDGSPPCGISNNHEPVQHRSRPLMKTSRLHVRRDLQCSVHEDCETSYTTDGVEVVRVGLVNVDGLCIMDL